MKILNTEDYSPEAGAVVFRQGRFATALGSLIMIVIFGGIPLIYIEFELPKIFLWMMLFLNLILIPLFLTTLVAVFRQSNWVMAIEQDSLWINLRSYTAYKYYPAQTVVRVEFSEIEAVAPYKTEPIQLTRGEDETLQGRVEKSLLINFNHDMTTELKEAVHEENNRREEKKILFGLGTSRTKIGHNHAHIKSDRLLKITWKGFNNSIYFKPNLEKTLDILSRHVTVSEPVEKLPAQNISVGDSDSHSVEESQILDLIETGDKMTAIKLAREVYGFGLKEAKNFVEELQTGG